MLHSVVIAQNSENTKSLLVYVFQVLKRIGCSEHPRNAWSKGLLSFLGTSGREVAKLMGLKSAAPIKTTVPARPTGAYQPWRRDWCRKGLSVTIAIADFPMNSPSSALDLCMADEQHRRRL